MCIRDSAAAATAQLTPCAGAEGDGAATIHTVLAGPTAGTARRRVLLSLPPGAGRLFAFVVTMTAENAKSHGNRLRRGAALP